ncbi:hypothetical protein D3C72_2219720 [compost metagenome]
MNGSLMVALVEPQALMFNEAFRTLLLARLSTTCRPTRVLPLQVMFRPMVLESSLVPS